MPFRSQISTCSSVELLVPPEKALSDARIRSEGHRSHSTALSHGTPHPLTSVCPQEGRATLVQNVAECLPHRKYDYVTGHKNKRNTTDRPDRINSGVGFYLDVDDFYCKNFSKLVRPQGSLPGLVEHRDGDIEKTGSEFYQKTWGS